MKKISIFCLTLNPAHEEIIKKLSYIPVGLGNKKFSNNCLSDKKGTNISDKNSFYGEYTFHYWIWKNYLNEIKTNWVGFCQYRKFFAEKELSEKNIKFEQFKQSIIHEIDTSDKSYDCILGNKFSVQNYKLSKIIKNHFLEFMLKPSLFFNKEKRNLKLHFDLFHGKGNLDFAIELLDENNRIDFKNYMNSKTSFNPHNMFICKTEILKNYYDIVFPWLAKCENKFGFNNLNGYGLKRIYGFLAERFLSYWFTKNHNIKELPIIAKDLSDYKNL
tara:strand:- start:419 stop:1240 length:822 start_codon:yes stop_codon:yes gene_type:complete